MTSVLLEFYKSFSQNEHVVIKNAEYDSMNDKIKEEREYLISRLSPEDVRRLIKLESLYTETSSIYEAELFCRGFRRAVLLMAEVYNT